MSDKGDAKADAQDNAKRFIEGLSKKGIKAIVLDMDRYPSRNRQLLFSCVLFSGIHGFPAW
jgi:predicted Rossmann fold nucleotide-binding protein DprA/Smf involved in DNA uptake